MNATWCLRACSVASVLALAGLASSQVYVQQGNALDANTRVGSGGLNYGGREYAPSLANRIVTGNVAGGAAFRGYSPVQDPSSLFFMNYGTSLGTNVAGTGLSSLTTGYSPYGLPSGRLSVFNSQSVSPGAVLQGVNAGNAPRTPYYSYSNTVVPTGALVARLNVPGSSQPISPYTPIQPNLRILPPNPLSTLPPEQGSLLNVNPVLVRVDNGQQLTGPVNQRLLGSTLFGAVRELPANLVAAQARINSGQALATPPEGAGLTPQPPPPGPQPAANQPPPGTGQNNAPQNNAAGLSIPSEDGTLAAAGPAARLRDTSGTLARPLTPEQAAIAQAQARAGAPLRPGAGASTPPLRSFVGSQALALNQRLDEAEDLLKKGQYYRAAEIYAVAQTIDPTSPLPLLGRSVALLCAGDYMSSVNSLFTAIRLLGPQEAARVDLKAFVSSVSVLEARRKDLEQRLQLFDDFRLRFLLGYLQYSTGQTEAGLANMERAAKQAPVELDAVREFVSYLRRQSAAAATRPVK